MQKQFTPRFSYLDMTLNAVALCSQGANSRAHILLTKSMKEGNPSMEFNDILAGLTPEAQAVVNKHIEDATTQAVNAAVAPLTAQVTELTETNKSLTEAAKGAAEPTVPEDVMKSLPESVQKQFEEMQKSIKALEDEKEENLAKSRFNIVKAIPCDEATLKSVLKTASPEVFAVLTKAAASIEEGLGKTAAAAGEGSTVVSSDDAYAALEKHAEVIAKSENVTDAVAFTMACEQHPDLYDQYVKGE